MIGKVSMKIGFLMGVFVPTRKCENMIENKVGTSGKRVVLFSLTFI